MNEPIINGDDYTCLNSTVDIDCRRKGLSGKFVALKKWKYANIYCNKITSVFVPHVKRIYASENRIKKIECPEAVFLQIEDNLLTELALPLVETLYAKNNLLKKLFLPKVTVLNCQQNFLEYIYAPEVTLLYCRENPIKYIYAPKLEEGNIFSFTGFKILEKRTQLGLSPIHGKFQGQFLVKSWQEWESSIDQGFLEGEDELLNAYSILKGAIFGPKIDF